MTSLEEMKIYQNYVDLFSTTETTEIGDGITKSKIDGDTSRNVLLDVLGK